MKKKSLILMLILTLCVVLGCGTTSEAAAKCVRSLSVKKQITVEEGSSKKVKVNIKANKKSAKALDVKVKDRKIAKIKYNLNKGTLNVFGLKEGSTKVTITTKAKNRKGNKIKKSFTVYVISDPYEEEDDSTDADKVEVNDSRINSDKKTRNDSGSDTDKKTSDDSSSDTDKKTSDDSSSDTDKKTSDDSSSDADKKTSDDSSSDADKKTSDDSMTDTDNIINDDTTDKGEDGAGKNIEKQEKTDIASDSITNRWTDRLITIVGRMGYTGEPLTPEFRLYEEKTLEKGVDYEVEYANNINVGIADVIITGIGDYCGTRIEHFEILKSTSFVRGLPWNNHIIEGDQVKLELEGAYGDVRYEVGDESIAVIDDEGLLTGMGVGCTTVRAYISWDDNHTGSDSVYFGKVFVSKKEAQYCGFSVNVECNGEDVYKVENYINRDNDGIFENTLTFVCDANEEWIDKNVTFEVEDVTPKQIRQTFKDLNVENNLELEMELTSATSSYDDGKDQFMIIKKGEPIVYTNTVMSAKYVKVRAGITTRVIKVTAKVNGKVVSTVYTGGSARSITESRDEELCLQLRHMVEARLWTDDMSNYQKLKSVADYISSTTHYNDSLSCYKSVNPTLWERYGIDDKDLFVNMIKDVLMNEFAFYQGGFAKCTSVSELRTIAIDDLGITSDHTAEGESVWIGTGSYSSAPYNSNHSSLIYQFEDGSRVFLDMEGTQDGTPCENHGCLDNIVSLK